MSGSGGGFGGGSVADVACSALIINTQIATPNPEFFASIQTGEVFAVRLVHMNDVQVVAVVRSNDDLMGGLAGGAIRRLRDCIIAGTNYHATVTRVSGPQILVRIEPEPV